MLGRQTYRRSLTTNEFLTGEKLIAIGFHNILLCIAWRSWDIWVWHGMTMSRNLQDEDLGAYGLDRVIHSNSPIPQATSGK